MSISTALPHSGVVLTNTDVTPISGGKGKAPEPGQKPPKGSDGGGGGSDDGEGGGQPGGDGVGHGECGGGAGGDPSGTNAAADAAEAAGILPPERTDHEIDRARRKTLQDLLDDPRFQGGEAGWGEGGDLGMRRFAEDYLGAKQIPWDQLLQSGIRGALTEAGRADYSKRRPGRRTHSYKGAPIASSLRARQVNVAVVVDTSPSVSKLGLTTSVNEAAHVMFSAKVGRVDLIAVAWEASEAVRVFNRADIEANLATGGGTDMSAGIAEAETLSPPPDVTIVFTDGGTPWPEYTALKRVIIVVIPEGWAHQPTKSLVEQAQKQSWAYEVIPVGLDESLGRMGR